MPTGTMDPAAAARRTQRDGSNPHSQGCSQLPQQRELLGRSSSLLERQRFWPRADWAAGSTPCSRPSVCPSLQNHGVRGSLVSAEANTGEFRPGMTLSVIIRSELYAILRPAINKQTHKNNIKYFQLIFNTSFSSFLWKGKLIPVRYLLIAEHQRK